MNKVFGTELNNSTVYFANCSDSTCTRVYLIYFPLVVMVSCQYYRRGKTSRMSEARQDAHGGGADPVSMQAFWLCGNLDTSKVTTRGEPSDKTAWCWLRMKPKSLLLPECWQLFHVEKRLLHNQTKAQCQHLHAPSSLWWVYIRVTWRWPWPLRLECIFEKQMFPAETT